MLQLITKEAHENYIGKAWENHMRLMRGIVENCQVHCVIEARRQTTNLPCRSDFSFFSPTPGKTKKRRLNCATDENLNVQGLHGKKKILQ